MGRAAGCRCAAHLGQFQPARRRSQAISLGGPGYIHGLEHRSPSLPRIRSMPESVPAHRQCHSSHRGRRSNWSNCARGAPRWTGAEGEASSSDSAACCARPRDDRPPATCSTPSPRAPQDLSPFELVETIGSNDEDARSATGAPAPDSTVARRPARGRGPDDQLIPKQRRALHGVGRAPARCLATDTPGARPGTRATDASSEARIPDMPLQGSGRRAADVGATLPERRHRECHRCDPMDRGPPGTAAGEPRPPEARSSQR